MKPGIVTSELWLTVFGLALVNLEAVDVPRQQRGLLSLGMVAAYSISRGLAKYETPPVLPIGSALPGEPVDPVAVEMAEQRAVAGSDRIPDAI